MCVFVSVCVCVCVCVCVFCDSPWALSPIAFLVGGLGVCWCRGGGCVDRL